MGHKVLSIFPRVASTRMAIFDGAREIVRGDAKYDLFELSKFSHTSGHYRHRILSAAQLASDWLADLGGNELGAVIGPVMLPSKMPSGVYLIDEGFRRHLKRSESIGDLSRLGAAIAAEIAFPRGVPCYAAVTHRSEEFDALLRISGIPMLNFGRITYALQIKSAVAAAAKILGRPVGELSLVVAFLGKNFSISSHSEGRIRDASNSFERGPFSLVRSGSLPAAGIIRMAYSGGWSRVDLIKYVSDSGGMKSYTGTDKLSEVTSRAEDGDALSGLVVRGMAYQIAGEIAAQATVLGRKPDAIVFSGACAQNRVLMDMLRDRVAWITDRVIVVPGEDELAMMADLALKILDGDETARSYKDAVSSLQGGTTPP
jgi:butyrate kinase